MAIVVLTSLFYSPDYFPQFVRHYAELGAEAVHCTTLRVNDETLREAKRLVQSAPIPVAFYAASEQFQRSHLECIPKQELHRQARIGASDWYVPADLDEFIDFGEQLPGLCRKLESDGAEYAMGRLVDRVAPGGELAAFDPERSLAEQFPLRCHVTRDISGLDDQKVVLCHGLHATTNGHHRVVDESLPRYAKEFEVHHYAWRAGRREALERRADSYERAGHVAYDGPRRLLAHLDANGGRLAV